MLADVQGRQMEAKGRRAAQQAAQRPVGDRLAPVGAQRPLQHLQLRDQLGGAVVVAARHVPGVLGDPLARVHQPLADVVELHPVALAGVAALETAIGGRQRLAVAAQAEGQLRRHAVDLLRAAQLRRQALDGGDQLAQGVVVLQLQHGHGHLRRDQRVAVAVPADPASEAQRPRVRRQLDADPLHLLVQLVEQVRGDLAQHLVQVVDRRPRLVGGARALHAQLVGLPDQVDRLDQPPLDAGQIHLRLPRVGPFVEELADALQLGQHRAARRLGRMGGEDRPHVEARRHLAQCGAAVVVSLDVVEQGAQPAAADPAPRSVLADPVGLLGDVRQVEEGGEGAHQVGGVGDVEALQERGQLGARAASRGRVARLLAQRPHPLDQLQELRPVLADQGLPQQVAEQPDVGPQHRVGSG